MERPQSEETINQKGLFELIKMEKSLRQEKEIARLNLREIKSQHDYIRRTLKKIGEDIQKENDQTNY